jgi:5-methylcytosine-specific restriction protein A
VECLKQQRTVAAEHVDHKVALAAGGEKYDEGNLQGLCHSCHSRKTVACDGGGFGRKYEREPERRD